MRFVPISCIRSGMRLGRTLWGVQNELLLTAGTTLSDGYIESIRKLGLNGIYVDDAISGDVEIVTLISDTLRSETTKGIKNLFVTAEKTGTPPSLDLFSTQIGEIVDEILGNRNLMINMIDLKVFDNYTYAHSVNVAVLSIVIGLACGMNRDMLNRLGIGALLHDMGKVFTPKNILNKPGKLDPAELEEMHQHSQQGFEFVKKYYPELPPTSYVPILEHHEWHNGSGYPNGKSNGKITRFGAIIAMADVYDALTSERPYRKALSPSEAIEFFMASSGSQFNPALVQTFLKCIAPYPVGTCVTLSNGWIALVLENYESFGLRPRIRIFQKSGKDIEPYEINLRDQFEYTNLTITGIAEI